LFRRGWGALGRGFVREFGDWGIGDWGLEIGGLGRKEKLTFEIDVGGPVSWSVGNLTFAAAVEAGVIGGADAGVCGVESVE
jgi:hypothetical protein